MKKNLKQFSRLLGLQIVLVVSTAAGAEQGKPIETEAGANPAELRRSVFQDDLKNGKDPFFPK